MLAVSLFVSGPCLLGVIVIDIHAILHELNH